MPVQQTDESRAAPAWRWLPWQTGDSAEDAAREWLAPQLDLPRDLLVLARDPHGRPRLAPGYGADVGWSHSGAGLLLAFGRGMALGVDMERMHARPRAVELARRYFDPREVDWLQARDEATRPTAFLRLWCAKEAVLKAHGRGLSFGLHRLVFEQRGEQLVLTETDPALGAPAEWRLQEFTPHPDYLAALAWKPSTPL